MSNTKCKVYICKILDPFDKVLKKTLMKLKGRADNYSVCGYQ